MNQRADLVLIDVRQRCVLGWTQRWYFNRFYVLENLRTIARARDDTAHLWVIKNPSQRESRHGHIRWNLRPNFVYGVQGNIEIDAGKRFSAIKLFTLPVITAVVIRGELRLLGDLTPEQPAG